MKWLKHQRGQSLVEVVIGVAILSLVMISATTVAVQSSKAGTDSYDELRANELAEEGLEAMRAAREEWIRQNPLDDPGTQMIRWNNAFPSAPASPRRVSLDGSNSWYYNIGAGAETIGKFTRRIWVTNPNWSGGDPITDVIDGRRKRVTSAVSWVDQEGTQRSVSLDTILVDYQGINPSLPLPGGILPSPPPPNDELVINVTVETAPTLPRPRMRVFANRAGGAPVNGGAAIFNSIYPVGSVRPCPGYDASETCQTYNEVINLAPFGVTNALELLSGGQVRIEFSGDATGPGPIDNNLIINSVTLSGFSVDPALRYLSPTGSDYPVTFPLRMHSNGTGYWITGPPPPTLSFTADSYSLSHGGSTTLRWTSTNTTWCWGWGATWGGGDWKSSPNGTSPTGSLSGPASYTWNLRCGGPGGEITRSVTISVSAPPPPSYPPPSYPPQSYPPPSYPPPSYPPPSYPPPAYCWPIRCE